MPDELVNRMVEERIERAGLPGKVLFWTDIRGPLNQAQRSAASCWTRKGIRAVVVHLEVDYNVIVARLSGRRQCPACGTLYSFTTNPPRVSEVCDLRWSDAGDRATTTGKSVIRERLNAYDRQTAPVLEFFRQAGLRMCEIEGGDSSPEQIAQKICGSLDRAGLRS